MRPPSEPTQPQAFPTRMRAERVRRRRLSLVAGVVLAALALAGVCCGGGRQAPATGAAGRTLPPIATPTPPPTPRCVEPYLALGAARYRIQSLARAAEGSIAVPEAPGVAYWVEGTDVRYLFALSPSAENLALVDRLQAGDPAVITWADCLTDTYRVEAVGAAVPELAALMDQSSGGLTVYAGEPGGAGLWISAARPRAEATEEPEEGEEEGLPVTMAFGLPEVSADGATVTMAVTITNTGTVPLPVTAADFSLAPEGGAPQPPLRVEPALPVEIGPGAGVALRITFAHPGPGVALLRILDVTLEQYF